MTKNVQSTLVSQTEATQSSDPVQFYSRVALVLIFVILFFLIMRLFWLWYWKVNKVIKLLEDIKQNTSGGKSLPEGGSKA